MSLYIFTQAAIPKSSLETVMSLNAGLVAEKLVCPGAKESVGPLGLFLPLDVRLANCQHPSNSCYRFTAQV